MIKIIKLIKMKLIIIFYSITGGKRYMYMYILFHDTRDKYICYRNQLILYKIRLARPLTITTALLLRHPSIH